MIILLGREQSELFTGHLAVQQISYMRAGSHDFFEIKTIPGICGATVTFVQDTKNNLLKVEEEKNIPFDGNAYSTFRVTLKDPTAIESMEFCLKILKEELERKSINPTELHLYADGKELMTKSTKEDERYLYYKSVSGEIGEVDDYVIGKAATEKAGQPTTALPLPVPEEKIEPAAPEPVTEEPSQEPAPASAEEIIPPPKSSFWQRFWGWIRNLFGSS